VALIIAAPWTILQAKADWMKSEVKDEMRGRSITVISQTASPNYGAGPKATLTVLDKNDGKPGVVLTLESGRTKGCPGTGGSYCKVNIKFDDGMVSEELFATDDGKRLFPSKVVAFVGTITKSKNLFVEVTLEEYGTLQYKFPVLGLDVSLDRGPVLKILDYKVGEKYAEVGHPLVKSKTEGLDICYVGNDVEGVFGAGRVKTATLCFYDGVFYSAIIIPGTKLAFNSGVKYLNSVFGKPDPDAVYPSWPNDGDKLLKASTKSVAYLTFGKNTYGDPFIISDEIISPLVPEAVKP